MDVARWLLGARARSLERLPIIMVRIIDGSLDLRTFWRSDPFAILCVMAPPCHVEVGDSRRRRQRQSAPAYGHLASLGFRFHARVIRVCTKTFHGAEQVSWSYLSRNWMDQRRRSRISHDLIWVRTGWKRERDIRERRQGLVYVLGHPIMNGCDTVGYLILRSRVL